MRKRRSRAALAGVLALAISLTAGLTLGGVADAAKGKKKKGGNVANVTRTNIPIGQATATSATTTPITLNVGKKFKGKVVGGSGPTMTVQLSGAAGALDEYILRLTAPNGRTVGLTSVGTSDSTSVGPLTITPNSPFGICSVPPCADPDARVTGPGFVGTVGDIGLAWFAGIKMRGTWTLKVIDFDPGNPPATMNLARLTVGAA
jgi:hypothetical protein